MLPFLGSHLKPLAFFGAKESREIVSNKFTMCKNEVCTLFTSRKYPSNMLVFRSQRKPNKPVIS